MFVYAFIPSVNVFKRKISKWQGPIFQCGECLICIFKVIQSDLVTPFTCRHSIFSLVLLHFSYYHTSLRTGTCACVNCFYCVPCKIKIILLFSDYHTGLDVILMFQIRPFPPTHMILPLRLTQEILT